MFAWLGFQTNHINICNTKPSPKWLLVFLCSSFCEPPEIYMYLCYNRLSPFIVCPNQGKPTRFNRSSTEACKSAPLRWRKVRKLVWALLRSNMCHLHSATSSLSLISRAKQNRNCCRGYCCPNASFELFLASDFSLSLYVELDIELFQ